MNVVVESQAFQCSLNGTALEGLTALLQRYQGLTRSHLTIKNVLFLT